MQQPRNSRTGTAALPGTGLNFAYFA